jgi:cyclin-dependent kinase 7
VYQHKSNLYLVLEYLEADLEMIIKDKGIVFTAADIKSWMWMMLEAIEFCHRHHILHRVSTTTTTTAARRTCRSTGSD